MKLKYTLVFSIISFFITTAGFSQELSDREIGFDVARTTIMLKEHGIKDQDLAREITMMRMIQSQQYVEMKKIEDGILQKITAEQIAKMNKKHVSNTEKVAFVDIPQTERDALIAFYNSTGGANWTNHNGWDVTNPSSDVSTWYGVVISNGHVVSLNLERNNLKGTLSDLNALTYLYSLNLNDNYNNFVGNAMPSWIGTMVGLKILSIRGYGFTGPMQDLSTLINLEFLDLMNNNFGGGTTTMPSWITRMVSLKNLILIRCGFIGSIPNLSTLTNLENLSLAGNAFGGTMPSWFNTMLSLKYLLLANCNFTGTIVDLSPLTNLLYLQLGNDLTFDIQPMPSWFGTMVKLQTLFLIYSNLTGPISDLSRLTDLKNLTLSGNNFNVIIPSWLYNLNKLETIWMDKCILKGQISADIGNLTMLRQLSLSNNSLDGSVPTEFNKLTKLNNLFLENNKLSGVIPNLTVLPLQQFLITSNKFRFVDFVNECQAYKTKMPGTNNNPFNYSPQAKINQPETLTKGTGQSIDLKMYADGDTRYLADDTYQWFKNGTAITGATSRVYTIPSLLATDASTYVCKSYHAANPDMSPLVLEREPITLKVINCTPVTGTLKASTESPAVNASTAFSLETATTGLTYKWTFYNDASGTTVKDGIQTTATASQSYSVAGSYLVRLEVTETNGCTTKFDKVVNASNGCISGTIETPTPATTIDGITVSFNTTSTGLTYEWRFYYLDGTTSGEVFTKPIATRKFDQPGTYKVTLEVSDASGCKANFEKMVTVTHTCVTATGKIRVSDSKNDTEVVVGYPATFDLIDGPSVTSQEWKFYNPDGTLKDTQNPIVTNGVSQTFTSPGTYKVTLTIKDFYDCLTTFEKAITVLSICEIPASERRDYGNYPLSIQTINQERVTTNSTNLMNTPIKIVFYGYGDKTDSDFIYSWKIFNPIGSLIETSTVAQPVFTPTVIGDYKIELHIIDKVGCVTDYTTTTSVTDICTFSESTRAGSIYLIDDYSTTSFVKINESKELNFRIYYEDPTKSLSYEWKIYDPNLVLVSEGNQIVFPFTLTKGGFHKVVLVIKDNATGCTTEYTKIIGSLIGNSCTELNPKSVVVKDLYLNLLKKLISRSISGETDAQINASPASAELIALKPYITNGTGDKIYDFTTIKNDTIQLISDVKFSFAPNREYDVHVSVPRGLYYDSDLTTEELNSYIEKNIYFNLSQYISSDNYLVSCYSQQMSKNANPDRVVLQPGDCTLESEVRYIDFCPTDCAPIEGTLTASTVTPVINTSTKFSFGTVAANLTYNWTVTNSGNVVVDTASNTTGLYSFIANTLGNYTISLKVVNEKKCETEFLKTITVIEPLPIVNCETHFNFNFKVPASVKGGILNNTEREHIANGIISFVNKNISEKLYLTTYDDHSSGVRTVALQNKYTTVFPDATTNTSNETQGGFFRIQDDFYNDTFRNTISYVPSGIISNTGITKKIDVSFFVISEDNFADITASKAAYADLLNSAKCNKIFFIFLDEGRFRNRTSNTYISPIEFASQLKGSAAINYSTTSNILTSDFISFSKAQIADESFKNVLSAFLDKSYTQVKSKKCTTASCVTTNPNSQVVKGLFVNLVNKLQSLPAGTVTNGYTCAELIALTPFITIPNPAIFNYNQGSFSFSNSVNNNDVFIGANAQVTEVNLESYVDSESETNFIAKFGSIEKGCSVKHINFCPEKLCTSIEGSLRSTPQVLNANVNASFSLETTATNLTYDWTFYNLDNTTALAKATTAIPTQSFTAAGRYRIVLNVKDDKGCVTPFETFTTVLPACTVITGVIKIGSGSTPTPNPTPILTKSYWYQAVHPLDFRGTDYVIYIDGNGVKQTYTLTRTESGYNAPCVEIIASSIFNHSGATSCVSE
ncbi:hypothetical protein CLU83_4636 [Flavobacterium sp. 1]|uniref:PKD domain-containing protein n=1 Tax=Flavobacterium sp. 1 TaxID=2035200 RepID=UPI000C245868|nr:PKD domain-containing protein [Flavobacterium sp. 1]PJJ11140.1 hypothetical protein CLU83_4636 [Flavobacterium sp. 1]